MTEKELSDFIEHGESGFVEFALVFGDGWASQAIQIAKELRIRKEWVGLTDEDKNQIAKEAYNKAELTAWELAQRVGEFTEAKLKEKNHADS